MLLPEFSTSAGTVFQLQLLSVRVGLSTILDINGNASEETEVLEYERVETFEYYKSRNRLSLSAVATNRK